MALIKVRATAKGFNGGPNPRLKSIWQYTGNPKLLIQDEDRGMKNVGDVFMIEQSQFADTWMELVDPPAPVAKAVVAEVNAIMTDAPKRGRPKKTV